MASDLNNVSLVGRLTKDLELNQTGTVGRISLAFTTNEKQQDGTWKDVSNFVNASLFGKRATTLQQYLKKGQRVGIVGSLKFNQWQGKDGQKHSDLSIVVNDLQLLGGSGNGQQNPAPQNSGNIQQQASVQFVGDEPFPENIPF